MSFTHLDLFSGKCGFTLAFGAAGFKTVGFAEINQDCCNFIKDEFPSTPNYGDFRNVPRTSVDVVTAGVPCQPASTAGKKRGPSDDRWLWEDAISVVSEIRPIFAVFENVSGLITLHGGRPFNRIISQLYEGGFDVWWTHIPACAVGSPQERLRILIVAHSRSAFEFELQSPIRRRCSCEGKDEEIGNCPNGHNQRELQSEGSIQIGRRRAVYVPSKEHFNTDWENRLVSLCGVGDGVSRRLRETKPFGNAIVPQMIYPLAKSIYSILTKP